MATASSDDWEELGGLAMGIRWDQTVLSRDNAFMTVLINSFYRSGLRRSPDGPVDSWGSAVGKLGGRDWAR
ncbi:MAG: hypothetical protein AAGF75_02190 [Cyanobacteria bacterium P01_H01_bin.130]